MKSKKSRCKPKSWRVSASLVVTYTSLKQAVYKFWCLSSAWNRGFQNEQPAQYCDLIVSFISALQSKWHPFPSNCCPWMQHWVQLRIVLSIPSPFTLYHSLMGCCTKGFLEVQLHWISGFTPEGAPHCCFQQKIFLSVTSSLQILWVTLTTLCEMWPRIFHHSRWNWDSFPTYRPAFPLPSLILFSFFFC